MWWSAALPLLAFWSLFLDRTIAFLALAFPFSRLSVVALSRFGGLVAWIWLVVTAVLRVAFDCPRDLQMHAPSAPVLPGS